LDKINGKMMKVKQKAFIAPTAITNDKEYLEGAARQRLLSV